MAATKTECPVSRAEFKSHAKSMTVAEFAALFTPDTVVEAREFSTGSMGWYLSGKVSVPVNGTKVKTQVGLNLTVVGSKDLPKE